MRNFFKNEGFVKFACLLLALVLLTSILCACSASSKDQKANSDSSPETTIPEQNTEKEQAMDKDIYIIDTLEDKNGHVIQKTVFNAVTKHTYIYTFSYESNAWGVVCKNSGVIIITEEGEIISPDTMPEIPELPAQ